MADVAISAAMRSNLLSLQTTQGLLDKTQLTLSTGRKINSALDGAQAFFAAQSLNNRASDLSKLLDAMGQSISTIQQADKGVSSLTKLLDQAEAIATQAKDEISAAAGRATAFGTVDLSAVSDLDSLNGITAGGSSDVFNIALNGTRTQTITIASGDNADTLAAKINDAGGTGATGLEGHIDAKVNAAGQLEISSLTDGDYIRLEGSGSAIGTVDLSATGFQSLGLGDVVTAEGDGSAATGARVGGTIVSGNALYSKAVADVDNATASTKLSHADVGFISGFDIPANESATLTLTVDGVVSAGVTIDVDTTIQGLIDGINSDTLINDKVTASFDETLGKIKIETTGDVGNILITQTATDAGDGFVTSLGFASGASDDTFGNTNGYIASELVTFSGGTADVTQLVNDYNELRTQIDGLVDDANYRGVNLLKGSNLETVFNEDRSNTLTTEGVTFTASGLGITAADFSNTGAVTTSLTQLRTAKSSVRNFGSSIANDLAIIQTREDFTKQTISTLQTGSDKLTLADQNEESANMLALQIRQQLGFVSLSLASQSQQGVLRLF